MGKIPGIKFIFLNFVTIHLHNCKQYCIVNRAWSKKEKEDKEEKHRKIEERRSGKIMEKKYKEKAENKGKRRK